MPTFFIKEDKMDKRNVTHFVDKAIAKPSAIFQKPEDVVFCPFLDRKEKEKALENWKATVLHQSESTFEGMRTTSIPAPSMLGYINSALDEVRSETSA